jgi:hypothetical protein
MGEFFCRAEDLDLPEDLYQDINRAITHNALIESATCHTKNSGINIWQKIFLTATLADGKFQIYRLPDPLLERVVDHCRSVIDAVGQPYKIRMKSIINARQLFPHTDIELMDHTPSQGDRCSLVFGIRCQDEVTNFYRFSGDQWRYRLRDFLRLRRAASLTVKPREAWLYNNVAIHSVTGCDRKNQRFLLVLSWSSIDYNDMKHKYQEIQQ